MESTLQLKHCTICKEAKLATTDNFNRKLKNADGLQSACRVCNKRASKRYYKDNKTKHKAIVTERKKLRISENREFLREILESNPCVDCGESDIRILDFDHIKGKKIACVTLMAVSPVGLKKLKHEVEKCVVECANCHRRKSQIDQDSWRCR